MIFRTTSLSLVATILVAAPAITCFSQAAKEPVYNARFRVISWDSPITGLQYNSAKDQVTSIDITPFSRSMFYDYAGPDPLSFGHQKAAPDGKMTIDNLASVSLKKFKERTLLIFRPDQKNAGHFTISVIDDGDSSLPMGGYKFINLSKLPISVKCGNTKGYVVAGQSLTLVGSITDGSDLMPVEMFIEDHGQNRRIYSNRWGYGKSTRTIVFINYDEFSDSYLVKRIQEDIAAIPTPTPSPIR